VIIVAGAIYVRPKSRDAFVAESLETMSKARQAPGCLDFVVAADPIDNDRVNVFERWDSEVALETFRGDGPGSTLVSKIVRASVARYTVSRSGPA